MAIECYLFNICLNTRHGTAPLLFSHSDLASPRPHDASSPLDSRCATTRNSASGPRHALAAHHEPRRAHLRTATRAHALQGCDDAQRTPF